MLNLPSLGSLLATQRKAIGLTQAELAKRANVSRSTIDALENGRLAELGFGKITKILRSVDLELRVSEANYGRPTLDDLDQINAK